MRLKRLTVQGFKSFKDRTTIHFDDGITGIVGPNGCGKSNIVDALFWVMGEQSAKHLRGSTMRDVIFSGSSKYSPATWAEATLTLGNDEGKHIHIGNKVVSPAEIQLTRKLYRNGETEYRINNEPCRLKDIQEVFMDTGAGAKSYSIIAQGEINRLVQAKPEERRVMIEEVAGITKFKLRKRDSLKKIEQTEQNLNRLRDLQVEIEKNLKALEKQAEKAERARTLKEKVQRHDLIVHSHKVFDLLKEFREAGQDILKKREELESWSAEKSQLELSLQEERIKKDDLTSQIDDLQREYNEMSRALAGAEERLNSLCRTLSEREQMIEAKQQDIRESQEERENRAARLEELKSALSALEEEGQEDHDLGELQDKVALLRDELDELEQSAKDQRREVEQKKAELQKIDQTLFQNQSKQEEFSRTLQDLTQEIEISENQYSGVNSELKAERDQVLALEQEFGRLKEAEQKLKDELKLLHESKKAFEQRHREASKQKILLESRLSSLEEMNASLEGHEEGVKAAVHRFGQEGLALLGTLLRCEERYTAGVQKALAHWLEKLIRLDGEQDVLAWLQEQDQYSLELVTGAAENTPIGAEAIERLKLALGSELISMADVVTLDPKVSSLSAILEGHFLVEKIDFTSLSERPGLRFKSVFTFDGTQGVRVEDGAYVFMTAHGQSDQGLVMRNNTIEKLKLELVDVCRSFEELENEQSLLEENCLTKEQNYEQTRAEYLAVSSQYAASKSAFESKTSNLQAGQERLEILKRRKADTSALRLTLMEEEESHLKGQTRLRDEIEQLELTLNELQEKIDLMLEQYTESKEELVEKQVQAQSYGQRLESLKSQIEDVSLQLERQDQRILSATELVEKYQAEIEQMTQELEQLEMTNQDSASVLEEKNIVLSDVKELLAQLLLQMQEREDSVKELTSNINKNDKEITSLESKITRLVSEEEQITRNLFEKYHIDLRDCLGKYLEFEEDDYRSLADLTSMYTMETESGVEEIVKKPYEFNRRYGQDLKDSDVKLRQYRTELSRLGDINWQAIEEYDRQKLRYDFLSVQEGELKKSLENLQTAIIHIDEKSRERFKIAFEEVNTRFQKVFPIIFGGGSAQLKLTGDINDPECGVDIIAQPPGKNMQSINLMSGGEKAMTAVSLIFSIFLVKPSPFCLLDEVDAPLDDANVGRFNELLREMSKESQFILITHNKKTMELNDMLYGVTMQEPGVSKAVSVQLH